VGREKTQFAKGQSGNPNGRSRGSRHKASLAVEALLEGEAEGLTRKAVELALEGDTTALRLCLERIAPPAKERPIENYKLPKIDTLADALEAIKEIGEHLAEGHLLASEAGALCAVLEQYRKHFETTELEERLVSLEEAVK
jgi:hypothetical protein